VPVLLIWSASLALVGLNRLAEQIMLTTKRRFRLQEIGIVAQPVLDIEYWVPAVN
jgi:hypothetical protein